MTTPRCRIVRLAIAALAAGLAAGCASCSTKRLLTLEVGIGYGAGRAEGIEEWGPTYMAAIGIAQDNRDSWGLGGAGSLEVAPLRGESGSGVGALGTAIRVDATVGGADTVDALVYRWTAVGFVGYGGAGGGTVGRDNVGFTLFTGPTVGWLFERGAGLALSVGPYGMATTDGGLHGGGQARLRFSLGPVL